MRLHGQDVYDAYVEAGWWSQETLLDVLDRQVRERGDELAVADPPNRDELVGGQPKRWAWRDLDARVDSIASALVTVGIQRDDVVGVQLPNIVELPATLLAIMRIGAIASPFPVQFRAHEIVQLADIGGMVAMVTAARIGERADAEELVAIRDRTPSVHTVLALGAEEHDQVVALDVEGAPDRATLQQRVGEWSHHANDAVTLCWTSGTESAPKGVPRTSADWMAIARATTDAPPLDASDVLLNPFPMVNMAGIGGMMVPWLMTGAQLIMHHPFDLPTFLKQIAVERPTYTVAPPAVLNLLLAKEELLEQADV
ncbi:MAG: AMP-binding protein, partial [Actinomycetota bacterium]